jgi:hypothetical protein
MCLAIPNRHKFAHASKRLFCIQNFCVQIPDFTGWLALRGKGENEWVKHWAVLAGLSLKLYKDVWAEDSDKPLISIDLNDCEKIYPSESARNYGIEIKVWFGFVLIDIHDEILNPK